MSKEPAGYPVLIAFPEYFEHGLGASVWCPHCRVWHSHSWEAGDRAAHCHSGGPFKEEGYYLRLISKAKAKELIRDLQTYVDAKPRREAEN